MSYERVSASQIEKGMVLLRKKGDEVLRLNVVRVTKNSIQYQDWTRYTKFVSKKDADGNERVFAVVKENP